MKEKLSELFTSWYFNPIKFCIDCFGEEPDALQKEMFEAVAKYNRVAVRSGNGPGKSWSMAKLGLWFFFTRPYSDVITTAPTWDQVQRVIWKEIRANMAKSELLKSFVDLLPRDPTMFMIQEDGTKNDDWAMFGRSSTQKENMQGYHAKHLMFIIDEASGVDDEIFEAIEGSQTEAGANKAKIVMIGNPTRTEGYFFEAFHSKSGLWKTIHFDCRLSPRVSKEWIEQKKEEYGEESPFYKVRVLGEFPLGGDNALIPLHWIEKAVLN